MVLKGHGVKAGQPTAGVSTRLFCPTQAERKESFEAGRGIQVFVSVVPVASPLLAADRNPNLPQQVSQMTAKRANNEQTDLHGPAAP